MGKLLAKKLTSLSFALRQRCENKDKVAIERLGLAYSEFRLLNLYTSKKQYTVKELAERLDITSGAITQVVTNLQKKEMVDRNIAPDDRRNIIVSLTEKGADMVRNIEAELNAIHHEILIKLEKNEREHLVNVIEKYTHLIGQWLDDKQSE